MADVAQRVRLRPRSGKSLSDGRGHDGASFQPAPSARVDRAVERYRAIPSAPQVRGKACVAESLRRAVINSQRLTWTGEAATGA
jgi:hypothetical protein